MKIFIDLDGTILDIKNRYYIIHKKLAYDFGSNPLSKNYYWRKKREGFSEKVIVSQILPQNLLDKYLQKRKKIIEDLYFLSVDTLNIGVYDVLKMMKAQHEMILITARKNKKNLFKQLKTLNIDKIFSKILTPDLLNKDLNTTETKYLLILTQLGDQEESLLISDSQSDILAGKKAGIKTIAVSSGIRNKDILEKIKPDELINSLTDITKILYTETRR